MEPVIGGFQNILEPQLVPRFLPCGLKATTKPHTPTGASERVASEAGWAISLTLSSAVCTDLRAESRRRLIEGREHTRWRVGVSL